MFRSVEKMTGCHHLAQQSFGFDGAIGNMKDVGKVNACIDYTNIIAIFDITIIFVPK